MHEIRIAEDLSTLVLDVAEKEHLSKITRVSIIFGRMVQIVPEIFEFAFRETVRDSVAMNAELDIELAEIRLRCRNCGQDFQPENDIFYCSNCNSYETDIIQGNELFIKSIEGE